MLRANVKRWWRRRFRLKWFQQGWNDGFEAGCFVERRYPGILPTPNHEEYPED